MSRCCEARKLREILREPRSTHPKKRQLPQHPRAEANSDTPANPGAESNTAKLFPYIPRAIGPNVNLPLNAKMRNAILGHRPPKAVTT
jgi:hypothetical protein